MKKQRSKHKKKTDISSAIIHIKATFNNVLVAITDTGGNVLIFDSAGGAGFSGKKKSTPFAGGEVAKRSVKRLFEICPNCVYFEIEIKGAGPGRETALRSAAAAVITESGGSARVGKLSDKTPLPHNGCRPPKMRKG